MFEKHAQSAQLKVKTLVAEIGHRTPTGALGSATDECSSGRVLAVQPPVARIRMWLSGLAPARPAGRLLDCCCRRISAPDVSGASGPALGVAADGALASALQNRKVPPHRGLHRGAGQRCEGPQRRGSLAHTSSIPELCEYISAKRLREQSAMNPV